MTWKTAILSSALVLLPMAATAQDGPQTQWDELVQSSALQPEEDVYVTLVTGSRIRGRIGEVTSTALTLTDGEDVQEYREADIATIERRDPISNGILIGLGVGFLVNIPIGVGHSDSDSVPIGLVIAPLIIGAAIGGAVDSNHNSILYEAGSAQVSVVPTLSIGNRGVGVRMSVGW